MKSIALILLLSAGINFSPVRPLSPTPSPYQEEAVYNPACCKICKKGKACGDSCISREYQCHKPKGCACDG